MEMTKLRIDDEDCQDGKFVVYFLLPGTLDP